MSPTTFGYTWSVLGAIIDPFVGSLFLIPIMYIFIILIILSRIRKRTPIRTQHNENHLEQSPNKKGRTTQKLGVNC